MKESHKKIIAELETQTIPDLQFLFSNENLSEASELLKILLEDEKQKFEEKLVIPDDEISFETFNDESILNYYWNYIHHLKWVFSSDQVREIIDEIEPLLVDFSNMVSYSKRYFEMLTICKQNCDLDTEQWKIIDDAIKSYRVRWIDLEESKQDDLKEISKQLSELTTKFSNNELDSQNEFFYHVEDDSHIKDLPKDVLDSAKKLAWEQWKQGFVFTANPNDYVNIMKFCDDKNIRHDFYTARTWYASSWKNDNRENVLKILQLREKKSHILWYNNYAELSLEFKMADSPEQILELIDGISTKAQEKWKEEIIFLKEYFTLETLDEWDMWYYYRKLKEEKYKLDDKELKKYFEFEAVISWLHTIVGKLFWITLEETTSEEQREMFGEGSDVRIYKVYRWWKQIAYYLLDPFYRSEKRAWAWADDIRPKYKGKLPFVINVCNFTKNEDVTLLSLWEVQTIFHEFGHATHEMLGTSPHSDLTWFEVEWDFVEVPSQFLEHWCEEEESLKLFAKHYQTWEVLPQHYIETLKILDTIWNGNFVLKQNEYTYVDMLLHSQKCPDSVEALDSVIHEIVTKYSNFPKQENYRPYTSFSHIFSWGYAAGYYSYMWAEILELDILREFKKKWMFNKKLSQKYTQIILEGWSTKPAKELFEKFMWREVDLQWFFEKKWI